jgi:hypothetical protein
MKKRILLGVWIVLAILTGCSRSSPTATDILAKLLTLPGTPPTTIYFEGAVPENDGYLSLHMEEKLYCGQSPAALSDAFAVALCKDDQVYEIHIFHSLDEEKAEQIETILRRRQTVLQKQENFLYDPENPGAGAVIWRRGKWVCLLVTNDNDAAKAVLRELI